MKFACWYSGGVILLSLKIRFDSLVPFDNAQGRDKSTQIEKNLLNGER